MSWLVEPFELAFQQRALLAGVLAAVTLAVVGTWVVIRGMSFLGDALAHGIVPGVALAVLFGFNQYLGAVVAAVVMIVGVNLVHRQTTFGEDTGIGLLFVGMLALGVIIVSRSESFAGNLTGILFGDVLSVSDGELAVMAVVAAVALLLSAMFYRPFIVLAFNEQKAAVLGLHPTVAHFTLLGLVTLGLVGSFPTVGTLLVFGLLVGPPATAALLVRRVPTVMGAAALIGILSVVAGLLFSYHANTSGSATVAVIPVALFFVVLAFRHVRGRPHRTGP